MKIVRFRKGRKANYGILDGETIRPIGGSPFHTLKRTGDTVRLAEVRLIAPCVPSKVIALGLNYRSHTLELKMPFPTEPLIFLKPSTSVIGPEEGIVYPPSSKRVDYEGEFGVVIGRRASRINANQAPDFILGYTCVNDVTARDLQSKDVQWTRAKGFDTFAPIGPCIETELDPARVSVETYLNGELKQKGSTSDLVFPVFEIVSFISQVMTLLPGDVIATGTPSGIGPMQRGDIIEIHISNLGTLRNHVI